MTKKKNEKKKGTQRGKEEVKAFFSEGEVMVLLKGLMDFTGLLDIFSTKQQDTKSIYKINGF